jgi:molybdopterin-guanine dinucleotide biosynthesis protein
VEETPVASAPIEEPPDPGDDEHDEDGEQEEKRGKRNLDRRFRKLTGRLREKDAELAQLRAQVDTLTRVVRPSQQQEEQRTAAQPQPGAITPENYATHEEYLAALVESRARAIFDQEMATRDQRRIEAERQQRVIEAEQVHARRVAEAQERYEDWDEVMENATFPVDAALLEGLRESDMGPDLAYYLATHQQEAKKFQGMTPLAISRALGRLEAKLEADRHSSEAQASVEPPPPTIATTRQTIRQPSPRPQPLTPVGSVAGSTALTFDPSTGSFEDFKMWRKQGGGR